MLGTRLHRCCNAEKLLFINTRSGYNIGDPRRPFGKGTRFVEHDDIHILHYLYGLALSNEHSRTCSHSRSHHECGGRGKSQSTGARDDQYRNGRKESQCVDTELRIYPGEKARSPGCNGKKKIGEQQPGDKGEHSDAQHHGHKNRGDAVGKLLYGDLASLRLLHEANDMGEKGLFTDPVRPDVQQPFLVDGGTQHLVTRSAVYGHGFSRHHGLVDRTFTADDHAVCGNLLTRSYDHDVVDSHLFDGYVSFLAVP